MRSAQDSTGISEIRIFLGCSQELGDEIANFAATLKQIEQLPHVKRNYRLIPVRWEDSAFGGASREINETIQDAVEFDTLHIVVIGVWNQLGEGTKGEYKVARGLWETHQRPQILAYFRKPSEDAEPEQLEKLQTFKEQLIGDGVVPTQYRSADEFQAKLIGHIPRCLPSIVSEDPRPPEQLAKVFLGTAAAGFLLAFFTVLQAQLMTFPHAGVTDFRVHLILIAPPVLFLISSLSVYFYLRLLAALKGVWRSPSYTDEDLYRSFQGLIPTFAIPARLKAKFPQGLGHRLVPSMILILGIFGPGFAQYQCLFDEIVAWQYVVSHRHEIKDGQAIMLDVDRGRSVWPFGLQDPRVRQIHEQRQSTIFVHAQGAFSKAPADPLFRTNLGPQVFLPQQLWLYLLMMVTTCGLGVWVFYRLWSFPAELSSLSN